MRCLVIGFCLVAAACAGTSPTAPTLAAPASSAGGGVAEPELKRGAEVGLKGSLQAEEKIDEDNPDLHHLTGTGTGSHLGRFTYAADITVDAETGDGAGT